MVRLRVSMSWNIFVLVYYFNSNMVRLRASLDITIILPLKISIPTWYDWEMVWRCCNNKRTERISIPTWYDWEVVAVCRRVLVSAISIPTWYDWERKWRRLNFARRRFQFQHGTIESCGLLYCLIFTFFISIPTWYDWEFCIYVRYTEVKSISIPTWYDWEQKKIMPLQSDFYFNSNMVRLRETLNRFCPSATRCISIPTWYDWEYNHHSITLVDKDNFNSNMVRLRDWGVQHTHCK